MNVADVALRAVEVGALCAGAGTVAAFLWAFAGERVRLNKMTRLELPGSVRDHPELYWSFVALVTPRGHVSHLERAARRLDRLMALAAAVRASTGIVNAAMYKTAVDYESSIRHYLYKYFEKSGVPVYDRKRRHMVPGEDYEHAKKYGPFPIPYQMRCAHADIMDCVSSIVLDIHAVIPDKIREHAATLTFDHPRAFY